VGKSTFFNRVSGKRISIVLDLPGVTRDRILADAEWCGYNFTLIDTGGLELNSDDEMHTLIRAQAMAAVDMADVVIFMADGKFGIVSSDIDAAEMLKKTGIPVVLAVNKAENFRPELIFEYYELGLGEPFAISAEHGQGIGDLLDEVVKYFDKSLEETKDGALRLAVVGRPNNGKSSLVNKLAGAERMIVSDKAGTTRDSVDISIKRAGREIILVDTAGMRRKRSVEGGSVEAISAIRALKAVERADVAVILLDAGTEISEQDVRIAGYIHELGKPSVVAVNKWDLVDKDMFTVETYKAILDERLKFMDYYLPVFISAKTGKRADAVLTLAERAYENSRRRLTTSTLNGVIQNAVIAAEPPSFNGRKLKIYYATQASCVPPTFVLFVNNGELMHFSYRRYLENCLRRAVDFSGTPIKIEVRNRESDFAENRG